MKWACVIFTLKIFFREGIKQLIKNFILYFLFAFFHDKFHYDYLTSCIIYWFIKCVNIKLHYI